MNPTTQTQRFRETLANEATAYGVTLTTDAIDRLAKYYELLTAWNPRVHLVAPCPPAEFATRHVLESLLLLKHLPSEATVAEIGAGGGLPIIPCLIVRSELKAVLIEASEKKAVFLREALTQTATNKRATVIAERFENVAVPPVGFISCRALDRFEEMLPRLIDWAPPGATLLLFGGKGLRRSIEALGFAATAELVPRSEARFLFIVKNP